MSDSPGSWAEARARLAYLHGGDESGARAAADEWISEALRGAWGVDHESELPRIRRGLALQKAAGTILSLEDEHGDLAFVVGLRGIVAAAIARYFPSPAGPPAGPPFRLDPSELDRPTYDEWVAGRVVDDDFGPAPT